MLQLWGHFILSEILKAVIDEADTAFVDMGYLHLAEDERLVY